MSLYFDFPHFEEIFHSLPNKILLNEVPYVTVEEREIFNSLLETKINTDVLSSIPICECGHLEYGYNEGRVCPKCDTVVMMPNENSIDTRVWVRVPDGVDGFICPFIWTKLTQLIAARGYNVLIWAIDPKLEVPTKGLTKLTRDRIECLTQQGWIRSLNFFIKNWKLFFEIIETTSVKGKKRAEIIKGLAELRKYSDIFFPKYLPIPTKALMVIEETNLGKYADNDTMAAAIAAAKTIGVISRPRLPPMRPLSQKYLEGKTVDICLKLINYCVSTFRKNIYSKNGWLRGHGFRARSDFTMRAVVSSIPTPHFYGEMHVPWAQAVEVFKIHIYSQLAVKYKIYRRDASTLIERAGAMYIPIIDEIFKDLISNGIEIPRKIHDDIDFYRYRGLNEKQISQIVLPTHGIGIIVQRNPTLGLGSVQLQYLTRVKTDLTDKTVSMSDLIASGYNMDHDDSLICTFKPL